MRARIEVKDPELLGYFAELGEQDDFTPEFVQSNPVKVRTPDSVCDDPRRIRQILTAHPVWAEYDSRCIGCVLHHLLPDLQLLQRARPHLCGEPQAG